MTWESLIDLLSREFRHLRRMPIVNFGFATAPVTDVNELRSEELRSAERVDTIVRDFCNARYGPASDAAQWPHRRPGNGQLPRCACLDRGGNSASL